MGHWPSDAPAAARCTTRTTSRVDTVTGGPSLLAATQEHLDQGTDGASAMRDPLLGREPRFGEADAEIGGQEQRVVAEATAPAGRREDAALARGLDELRLGRRGLDVRHDAAKPGGALLGGHEGEALEQQRIVLGVEGPFPLPGDLSPVHQGPPCGEDPRGSVERVHFEPRVFAERREVTARREIARLGHGVLGEARAALQVLLFRQPLEELIRRKDELKRQRDENVADLPGLAVVAGSDQELHRLASRRSRPRSSLVEYPGTSATRTTRPPQPSTSVAPTMSSRA